MNFPSFILLLLMISPTPLLSQDAQIKLNWTKLSPIPDEIGFAGAYIATIEDYLVMMGGANFPDGKAPWEGGKKIWTDRVFMLKEKHGKWIEAGTLPEPMGYGAVASYRNAIYVAGGSNEVGHLSKVYKMVLNNDRLRAEELPDLPHTIANCASVQVGQYWYILGGIEFADSKSALNICWRMDLDNTQKGWEVCPSIPGEGRMLAVAGDMDGDLLVASGVSLYDGKRKYLRDAFVFNMETGWQDVPALPESVAAAPGPAWYDRQTGSLLIFGGDNGDLAAQDLRENHPGFSNRILCYQPSISAWSYVEDPIAVSTLHGDTKTWAPVTTGSLYWQGGVVLVSGEIRPGIRTPQILFGNYVTK